MTQRGDTPPCGARSSSPRPWSRSSGSAPRSSEIHGLDVLDERLVGRPGVHGWDPLRLSVDVRGIGHTGTRLAALMRERDDVNVELASENVVVAMFGMGEPAEPSADSASSTPCDGRSSRWAPTSDQPSSRSRLPRPGGASTCLPREAFLGPQEVVPFDQAVGRVAAESLAAYPPGIPNVLPGERLTRETVDYINEPWSSTAAGSGAPWIEASRRFGWSASESRRGGGLSGRPALGRRLRARAAPRRARLFSRQLPVAANQRHLPRHAGQRAPLRRRAAPSASTPRWSPPTRRPACESTSSTPTRRFHTRCLPATPAR